MREKFLTLLFVCAVAASAAGCGGGPGSSAAPSFSATPEQRPELNFDTLKDAINGTFIPAVPPANGQGKPENWVFDEDEPKEITVVEQKVEGDRATFVVDIKTRSTPRARNQKALEGRLRLTLELETEFVFRRWDVTDVENISFKYTSLNPPSPSPSPGASPGASPARPDTPPPGPPAPPPPPLE